MHILIVSQYFWPEDFRINDLALGLLERGHQVTVLTGIPNYPSGRFYPGYGIRGPWLERYQGVDIIRVPLVARGASKGLRLVLNYLSFALSASLLGPALCEGDFDSIFVFEVSPITIGLPAIVLKKAKHAPILFWVLDLWPESLSATETVRSPRILRMVERLVRFIYRNCDRVLVSSRGFVPRVEKLGGKPGRVNWFPQWAEALYRPVQLEENAPERSGLPEGFRIVFAGNIGAAQGFPTILAAAEKLKTHSDIHWLILGDGRMRGWVEGQVQERGLESTVHLLGRYPMEAMPRWFSLADAMLLTLKRHPIFALTIPAKVQSYLACARPIIAALDGEGAQVVEEAGAGLTCEADNSEALAETVLELYRMPESERLAMGQRGRAYYEAHFEREMLLDRLEGWMRELKRDNGVYGRDLD